jgi:ribosomal protein S6
MRNYELVCVIQPDLDEAAFNALLEKVKGWISWRTSSRSIAKVNSFC